MASGEPTARVVGPFLGYLGEKAVRVLIALPHLPLQSLDCVLAKGGRPVARVTASRSRKPYGLFTFDFDGLEPGALHHYWFEDGGSVLDLEDGLRPEDCQFAAPAPFGEDDSFLLMSCHDPFQRQPDRTADGWAAWPALLELLVRDSSIRFGVLGGDQVYNDEVEALALPLLREAAQEVTPGMGAPRLPADTGDSAEDTARQAFIRQYQRYWGDVRYRRVLARLPTVAMWDDHDVTDGWGGRPESLRDGEIEPEWRRYFDLAREAFQAYQAARNPPALMEGATRPFTTVVDFGRSRLFLLDLRSEKNAARNLLWSAAHEDAFGRALDASPSSVDRAFVLSPVVPLRTNFTEDARLSRLARNLFRFTQWLEDHRSWLWGATGTWVLFAIWVIAHPAVIGSSSEYVGWLVEAATAVLVGAALGGIWAVMRVPHLPKLTDDIEDGLSADCNRETLVRLLRRLFDWQRARRARVVLLSGDIHLGGMSEILDTHAGSLETIPQVVSSPVSYPPMPKVVAGFTTTTSEMVLADDGACRMVARNVLYTSRRNFAQVFPARVGTHRPAVLFHLEGHEQPLALPTRFLPE